MDWKFSGITLNDKFFPIEELTVWAEKMIRSKQLPKWEENIYQFILTFLNDQRFVEQMSSGTTGTPKKFLLDKQAMIQSAKNTIEVLGLKPTDNALLCLPIDYIAGKMMVVRAFVAGFNLYWEEPSSSPLWDKNQSIDFCAMVPMQVYTSLGTPDLFKRVKNIIIGGSELRTEVKKSLSDMPNNIYETYGMSETCSHIALRKISGQNQEKYFKTLKGITISVDERSCLKILADYLEAEVVTNDLVEIIDENHFVWKGRFDNLINSGGIKINPEELEETISKIVNLECAVTGIPDKILGQRVVLFVQSVKEIDRDELLDELKINLPVYSVPREIIVLKTLPRNKSFKIDRKRLIELIMKTE